MQILQPPGWARPRGYSNGIVASGRLVFISGQIGWDEQCQFQTNDFVGQVRQALQNVLAVLAESGGGPEHIARFTWYVVDRQEYLAGSKELGKAYQELMGKHYPAMTVVQVSALMETAAKVEIRSNGRYSVMFTSPPIPLCAAERGARITLIGRQSSGNR